jgi:hypothetical protein
VAGFNGRLVLPAQIPQGSYSNARPDSRVPHDELLEDVANATLGVSTASLKHGWFSTYRNVVPKDIRDRPGHTD